MSEAGEHATKAAVRTTATAYGVPSQVTDRTLRSTAGRAVVKLGGKATLLAAGTVGTVLVIILSLFLAVTGNLDLPAPPELTPGALEGTEALESSLGSRIVVEYQAAARRYDVPWDVIAALAQVTTDHGRYSPYDAWDRDPQRKATISPTGSQMQVALGTEQLTVPHDGGFTRAEFTRALLRLSGLPVSDLNVRFVVAWKRLENVAIEHNNPMATSRKVRDAHGNPIAGMYDINTHGVKHYPNLEIGMQAAVETLRATSYYTAVLDALASSDVATAAIALQHSPYCVGADGGECPGYGARILDTANSYVSDPQTWSRDAAKVLGVDADLSALTPASRWVPGSGPQNGSTSIVLSSYGGAVAAEGAEVWPRVNPEIGGGPGQGLGPFLLRPEVIPGDVDPQDYSEAVDLAASLMADVRDSLVDAGRDEPEPDEDPQGAAAFWADVVDRLPVALAADTDCVSKAAGQRAEDAIGVIWACELSAAPQLHVAIANQAGKPVEVAGYAAQSLLVGEAYDVAWAASAWGRGACDPDALYAGVFGLTVPQAAAQGVADRCDAAANIAAAARIVIAAEAIPLSQRPSDVGAWQPALAGWSQVGAAAGDDDSRRSFARHGPARAWVPSRACAREATNYVVALADSHRRWATLSPAESSTMTDEELRPWRDIAATVTDPVTEATSACRRAPRSDWVDVLSRRADALVTSGVGDSDEQARTNLEAPADSPLHGTTALARRVGVGAYLERIAAGERRDPDVPVWGVDPVVVRLSSRWIAPGTPPPPPPVWGASSSLGAQVVAAAKVIAGLDPDPGEGSRRFGQMFAPDGCPTEAPTGTMRRSAQGRSLYDICAASVAQARSPQAAAAIKYALSQLGDPYSQPNRSAENSYDCSSLVMRAYEAAGANVFPDGGWPPNTAAIRASGWAAEIPYAEARPGDLIFPHDGHVAMILADGLKVHTNATGDVAHVTDDYAPSAGPRVRIVDVTRLPA